MSGTRIGDVIASKYRLDELLGSGGMGHVYRATNVRVGRAVAIKILRSEHASNAPIVERFRREALAANLVRHPNVVDVLDVDEYEGAPFIVQELLNGEDLAKYVESRGGRLGLQDIQSFMLPVIEAVAEAHARGVVHRDIKPENVFLSDQGGRKVPKLLDFGISKVRLPDIKLTEVGVMMGTPAYMAPEQVQGSRDADPRTDIWALGIMLFELISGRLPYDAQDAPALFVAIATKDAPPLKDVMHGVDPDISRVVGRCLRRQPDDRYPSASELARDLKNALEGNEIEPTQQRSIPPGALKLAQGADVVPDLALPPMKTEFELTKKSDKSKALAQTEIAGKGGTPLIPELGLSPASQPKIAAAAPRPAPVPAPAPTSQPRIAAAPAPRADAPMEGVMLAGSSTSTQRRPPAPAPAFAPVTPKNTGTQDMSALVAIAVVGLVAIGVTAVLMSVAYQPEGFPVVALVTKPTAGINLAVQGALAVVGFVLAVRAALAGIRRWNGDAEGGRGSAVFFAVVAGGVFFVGLQLARAAF